MSNKITIEAVVNAPVEKVWEMYTSPDHITKWNHASDDWHSPSATNDLRVGGRFSSRMEAKDGSAGFDFEGVYTDVVEHQKISYKMDDGREVNVIFENPEGSTRVVVTFDPESENPADFQKEGWQAILNNFKQYAESL
ncbi:MAG: SRPBCC family protein [Minisyncoccota bacterium]